MIYRPMKRVAVQCGNHIRKSAWSNQPWYAPATTRGIGQSPWRGSPGLNQVIYPCTTRPPSSSDETSSVVEPCRLVNGVLEGFAFTRLSDLKTVVVVDHVNRGPLFGRRPNRRPRSSSAGVEFHGVLIRRSCDWPAGFFSGGPSFQPGRGTTDNCKNQPTQDIGLLHTAPSSQATPTCERRLWPVSRFLQRKKNTLTISTAHFPKRSSATRFTMHRIPPGTRGDSAAVSSCSTRLSATDLPHPAAWDGVAGVSVGGSLRYIHSWADGDGGKIIDHLRRRLLHQ